VQRLVRTGELREAIENHVLPASTLVWREGMKQWAPASSMPELSASAKKAELNRPQEPEEEEEEEEERPNRGDRNTPTAVMTSDADGPTAPGQVAIPKRAREPMRTLVGVQVADAEIESTASSTGAPIIVPPTTAAAKGASITIPPRFTPPPPPADSVPPDIPAAPRLPDTDDTDTEDEAPTRQKDMTAGLWSMGDDTDTLVRASELDDETADRAPEEPAPAVKKEEPAPAVKKEEPAPAVKKEEPAPAVKKRPAPSRPPPPLPARARGKMASRPPPPKEHKAQNERPSNKSSRPEPPRRAGVRTTAKWPASPSRNAPEPLRVPKSKRSRPKPPKPPSLRPAAPTHEIKVQEAPAGVETGDDGARINTMIGGLKPKAGAAATPLPRTATATPHPKTANTARAASDAKVGTVPRALPNLSDEDDVQTEVRPEERPETPTPTAPAVAPRASASSGEVTTPTPSASARAASTEAVTIPEPALKRASDRPPNGELPLPPRSEHPPPPPNETVEEVSVPPPAPVGFSSESGQSVRPSAFPHLRDPVSVPMSSLVATGGVWVLLLVSAFLVGRCTVVDKPPPKARAMLTQAVRGQRLPQPQAAPVAAGEPKPCWVTRQAVQWAPRANKSVAFGLRPTDEGTLELGYAVSSDHARGLEVNPKTGKATELFTREEDDGRKISRVTPLGSAQGGFFVSSKAEDDEEANNATTLPVAATPPFYLTIADQKVSLSDAADAAGDELWSTNSAEPVSAVRALSAPGTGFGLTFRQDGAIWSAWLGADRKPVGELTHIAGSGGKVGRPKSGWNTKEFAIIFADKPEDAERWQIRVGHAPSGSLPTDTVTLELPEGGPGGDAFAPDIVGLHDGRWLVMWTEGPGPGKRAVRAQTLTEDFTPIGDPIALSPPAGSFGQAVLGVVGTYTTVVFLSQGDEGFELWGAVLQCG